MQAIVPIAQLALIVAWFTVPAFMALPWYVIFAPILLFAAATAVWFLLVALVAIIAALWVACSRTGKW